MQASQKLGVIKQIEQLPDNYALVVHFIDGKSETFEAASHKLGPQILEIATSDDLWHWIQMANVKRIEFDRRFSKIIALRTAQEKA